MSGMWRQDSSGPALGLASTAAARRQAAEAGPHTQEWHCTGRGNASILGRSRSTHTFPGASVSGLLKGRL